MNAYSHTRKCVHQWQCGPESAEFHTSHTNVTAVGSSSTQTQHTHLTRWLVSTCLCEVADILLRVVFWCQLMHALANLRDDQTNKKACLMAPGLPPNSPTYYRLICIYRFWCLGDLQSLLSPVKNTAYFFFTWLYSQTTCMNLGQAIVLLCEHQLLICDYSNTSI
jgi:hypothetical protein